MHLRQQREVAAAFVQFVRDDLREHLFSEHFLLRALVVVLDRLVAQDREFLFFERRGHIAGAQEEWLARVDVHRSLLADALVQLRVEAMQVRRLSVACER